MGEYAPIRKNYTMSEKPILMSGPMVRAILEGRKSQTRRTIKPQPQPNGGIGLHPVEPYLTPSERWTWVLAGTGMGDGTSGNPCPYGSDGDRLWVKETWKPDPSFGYPPKTKPTEIDEGTNILYRATLPEDHPKALWQNWRPSLFMLHWMSRITLEITSIRVEQLQDISEEDAIAEGADLGVSGYCGVDQFTGAAIESMSHKAGYCTLWESINGPGSWEANPWVWVIEFKMI